MVREGDGLAVIGDAAAVDAFLASEGLEASGLELPQRGLFIASGGALAEAASTFAAGSGRWVKLTKESAKDIQKYGLMDSKTPGVSHAMIGKPGRTQKWIQVVKSPSATMTSPAVLSGVAGVMTQLAMQQAMGEVAEYLAGIDRKLDEVLRAQKDFVLADIIGVELTLEEAMTVRDHVGHVSDVTWSKVQSTHQTIATTQAYALRQIDSLTSKVKTKARVSGLAESAEEAADAVQDWLAVLARCFQLQDAAAILELDRVMVSAPEELDLHRVGLRAAREKRLEQIARSTGDLVQRLDEAAVRANSKVLWNPAQSPGVVRSSNTVAGSVLELDRRLGIERGRDEVVTRRWTEAAIEARDRALDRSAGGVREGRRRSSDALTAARNIGGKVSGRIADRAERRRSDGR